MADAEAADREIRNNLDIIQSMIDVSAQRLVGLRTQCATSAELTQHEIRTLEVNPNCLFLLQTFVLGQTHQTLFRPTDHKAETPQWGRRADSFLKPVAASGGAQQQLHPESLHEDLFRGGAAGEVGARIEGYSQ